MQTVVIEFARGGPHGSTFPIKPPQGYQYSLRYLSRDILAKCAMLYIWVTPEQSRKKNEERNIESAGLPNVRRGGYTVACISSLQTEPCSTAFRSVL